MLAFVERVQPPSGVFPRVVPSGPTTLPIVANAAIVGNVAHPASRCRAVPDPLDLRLERLQPVADVPRFGLRVVNHALTSIRTTFAGFSAVRLSRKFAHVCAAARFSAMKSCL